MARQLKFRAWDKVNKRMLHFGGFSWHDEYDLCYMEGRLDVPAGDNLEWMQFTGLKDSNGTDVYEGDLVKLTEQYIYEVRFEDGKFVGYHIKQEWGRWGDLKRLSDPDFAHRHHEVIGNIYQNAELLTH